MSDKSRDKRAVRPRRAVVFMALKYLFSLALITLAYAGVRSKGNALICLLELLAVAFLSNALAGRKLLPARIVNDVLILLFNTQMIVLFFGGDFITLVMLTNFDSLEALSGKFVIYGIGIVLVLVFSFLPISHVRLKRTSSTALLSAVLAAELVLTMIFGAAHSPYYHYYSLARDAKAHRDLQKTLASMPDKTENFYKTRIDDYKEKPAVLPEKPNLVVVFAEGLSANIITDERDIMPNTRDLAGRGINFTNYYNHTFATYRALIGQLYSGYQLDNLDTNTLISMQGLLAGEGYQTAFINTEPKNLEFTEYLETFGFDEVISDQSLDAGVNGTLSDKQAFETMFETMEEKKDGPFMIAMYTFGTHIATDSVDEKYGDGKTSILNRFYNLDTQLGAFIERFDKSEFADNTIVVFTADHASYANDEYNRAFPQEARIDAGLGAMPLIIYHKEIKPAAVDVQGRNTLDFAPTILDYIDVSADNYFLGTSLFSPAVNANSFDTVFYDGTHLFSTKDGEPKAVTESESAVVMPQITDYFAAKTQQPKH